MLGEPFSDESLLLPTSSEPPPLYSIGDMVRSGEKLIFLILVGDVGLSMPLMEPEFLERVSKIRRLACSRKRS